jgi:hypothetical protein
MLPTWLLSLQSSGLNERLLAKMADTCPAICFVSFHLFTEVQTFEADLGLVGTNSGAVVATTLSKVVGMKYITLIGSPLIAFLLAANYNYTVG